MKIQLPPFSICYGPIGHPGAEVQMLGETAQVEEGAHYRLNRASGQGNIPTVFFNDRESLEAQGYHILQVVDGEVPESVLAALPVPVRYKPAEPGAPGRKLQDFRQTLPSYTKLEVVEVWDEGSPACDHDIGLESATLKARTPAGDILDEQAAWEAPDCDYFHTYTCTRCGAVHAYPQI